MTKNITEVKILGQTYKICSEESASDTARFAAKVTEDITASIQNNKSAGSLTAAALVAMDYLSLREKAERELARIKNDTSSGAGEADRLKEQIDALKKENELAKEELSRAKEEVSEYRARIVVLEDKLSHAKKKGAKKGE